MNKIYQLPPHIVAKIAAGEVIERPAYAVKELIDNAIDAGADEISIYLEQSGLKKIQVTDNGEGMSKEDLIESIKPHTTSKIKPSDDLLGIKTLGFRGEALASLAAAANLIIKSKTTDSPIGYQLEITHGKGVQISPVGTPFGTTVIAEKLFTAIPARKKFLKSPQTELRHVIEIVGNFALSFPHIHFLLKHNNKTIFDFPKNQKLEERLSKILGEQVMFHFIPIKTDDSYIALSGFIAKPQVHTTSQTKQYIFVNSRRIADKLISLAIKESYGTMLEPSAYPIFVLYISLPHEMVDINVHPRKEQVAFINQKIVFETIKNSVMEVLQENNITFQNLSWKRSGVGTTKSYAANLLKENVLDKNSLALENNSSIIQIHKVYLVAQTKNGLLIFDQHAAHERVLFEKLLKEFRKQAKNKKLFILKDPIILDLSLVERELLKENKETLEKLGFNFLIRHSGKRSASRISLNDKSSWAGQDDVIVMNIPFLFQDRNPQEFIKEILERLEQGLSIKSVDDVSLEMLSFLACRAAVKAGDKLTQEQMEKIIHELEKTPNNATCPHGRPTRMYFDKKALDTMFNR